MRLRRKQKIIIAAAGGAAAVGIAAATVFAMRRGPKCASGTAYNELTGQCESIVSTPGPTSSGIKAFCTYPTSLTGADRESLEQEIFVPLVLEAGGDTWVGPEAINQGVANVAAAAIAALCPGGVTRPRTRQLALDLARSAWWSVNGMSGQ